MKNLLMILMCFFFLPANAQETAPATQLEIAQSRAKKYTCDLQSSYGGVIWNPEYPYPADPPYLDDRERVVYRKYQPTPAEEKAAYADCDRQLAKKQRLMQRMYQQQQDRDRAKKATKTKSAKRPK